ncbi:MAG TPA: GNAT family N-acetyltransferase [Vicinamibacterales bacterium]|jgi:RimJ/RimL family protein N-acetyltransferase
MILQGLRCSLRRWRTSDADALVRHANNINVAKHLRDRFPHPYTKEDAQTFLKTASTATPVSNFAIEVHNGAVGGLGFVVGTDVERFSAEVGYWLGEECWGRGIVTEALQLFTRYAFDDLRLLRVYALPLADNDASIRVLEKAGYFREGVLASSCVKYGEPRDQLLYARINASWRYS